jgi:hypothetical protein
MTDNLGPLRRAMSDLAEHGGSADLYERTLRKSRQTQRRTALAGGAAAVVFAIGGAVAIAAANRPEPSTPVATPPPAPRVTPSSAGPSTTPSLSAPSTTPASSAPALSAHASNRPRYPDCPSAKTLEKLAGLPKDWHIVASSVECWRTWASAGAKGPTPGDGIFLFQYKAGTGWRFHGEGSGMRCQDLGITSGNPPFCRTD